MDKEPFNGFLLLFLVSFMGCFAQFVLYIQIILYVNFATEWFHICIMHLPLFCTIAICHTMCVHEKFEVLIPVN